MNEAILRCPQCNTEIRVSESLAAPAIDAMREQYEHKVLQQMADIARRDAMIRQQQGEIASAQESIGRQIEETLEVERGRIAASESRKARLLLAIDLEQKAREIGDLQEVLRDRDSKLAEAQNAQAKLTRREQELSDAIREVELTVEKRVQKSLADVRRKAEQEAEEGLRMKLLEKEELVSSMQRRIEDLKRRVEQGSQQLQGEVQELHLEARLRRKFPRDVIDPVAKGQCGGDILHRVIGPQGQQCGTILWECKRTKNWSDKWPSKLRDDQRAAKADVALLVSQALPKAVETFSFMDGVWVTETRCAIPISIVLRQYLMEIAAIREASDGEQSKVKMVYQYLTGPRFRHRVEAIIEKFSDMQEDLARERQTIMRSWAKREEQIRLVIEATAGMHGDLQGIAGRSLPQIEGLEMPILEYARDNTEGKP